MEDELELIFPSKEYKEQIEEFKEEFIQNNENNIPGGGGLEREETFEAWMLKNRLQLLHDSLRSRLRGTIQRQVISTSTVFSTLIRVKSRNGRKWDTRSACGG